MGLLNFLSVTLFNFPQRRLGHFLLDLFFRYLIFFYPLSLFLFFKKIDVIY